MNRFTNNLYDSEIGGNVDESTLGLAQYGGATSFMNYATETVSDAVSSIKDDSIDTKKAITNAAKEVYNGVSNAANAFKDKIVDVADRLINGPDNNKLPDNDKLISIEPMMTTDNLPKSNMTNSQRLNYQSKQNNLDGSATISLYNNLNKIVGGCDCKKQYCGGFRLEYADNYQTLPYNENDLKLKNNEIINRNRSNTFDLPDSPFDLPDSPFDLPDSPFDNQPQNGGADITSTEEIRKKIDKITKGGAYGDGRPDTPDFDDLPSDIEEDDEWDTNTFDDLPSDLEYNDEWDTNTFDDLPSDLEDDFEKVEFKKGGAKSKSMKPGFSNFINGLYKECKMKGGKKKFNPEAIEWNKKTNEFIQTNFKIDDWDKIKIIKFVANTKNKKAIGEDKLKALSDVERAKMLYNTVSSMKPAEIKKIDFKKIQAQRVKILKEKFGEKYREPTKKEDKKEEPKKTTTKKTTKKGGNDNLFLGGEDSESIRLPGGFRY